MPKPSSFRIKFSPFCRRKSLACLSLLFLHAFVDGHWTREANGEDLAVNSAGMNSAQMEFFEKSVRPLLLNRCGDCHGSVTQWAGLRVDSLSSLLQGGDSGPAIVAGDPAASLLIASVRREGDYDMPPDDPLPPYEVEVLEKWIEMGAPWPEEPDLADAQDLHRGHWAFQPVSNDAPPAIDDPWCQTPVDAFVLQKLNEKGLTHSAPADRRTLFRRLSYGLTGLPPHPQEVEIFVNEVSTDRYENEVERLLESPQYAEHMARFWLDLARYSDTKGDVFSREENRFVHSWVYRDWVTKAFQDDIPYDQFLLLQIAADQLDPDNLENQAALGFLTLGRRFSGNVHDIIDDRIDVVGRTAVGLTFSCARCHDHKYDPIPIDDYYSLYGIFDNSLEEYLRLSSPDENQSEFEKELNRRMNVLQKGKQQHYQIASNRVRERLEDYLVAQTEIDNYSNVNFGQVLEPTDIIPAFVRRWDSYLIRARSSGDPVFYAWHRFAELSHEEFAARSQQVSDELKNSPAEISHPLVSQLFADPPESMREVAIRYAQLLKSVDQQWQDFIAEAAEKSMPSPQAFSDSDLEVLRQVLYADQSPCELPLNEGIVSTETYFDSKTAGTLWGMQNGVDRWLIEHPTAVPYSVRMVDRPHLSDPYVFRRGNPATKGKQVSRQLPSIIADEEDEPFLNESGRLGLAKGLVDPTNPLVARVWVNRIWQFHFGVGLVPTSSDFGVRAPQPEHLELLDWLATELISSGWSTKEIHRLILLSSTYQQSSSGPDDEAIRQQAELSDPENGLLWRQNRHRLTLEELRDSMLMSSAELDLTLGGRSTPLFPGPDVNHRRTLYGHIDRRELDDVFRVFDFANPELHIPVRSETMVPQQLLFLLNHPFVAQRASAIAEQLEAAHSSDTEQQIRDLYLRIFQRLPTADEMQMASEFLQQADAPAPAERSAKQMAWSYAYGKIDKVKSQVTDVTPLPYFHGESWQGGVSLPDYQLNRAQITATGGHPGNADEQAVVRRWTSPEKQTITIESSIKHDARNGNGIRCWIISSRNGPLYQSHIKQSSQSLNIDSIVIEEGDTIDFVVDSNGNATGDQFLWSINIQQQPLNQDQHNHSEQVVSWNSEADFVGPAPKYLQPLGQLVQVLLFSNEFHFVD